MSLSLLELFYGFEVCTLWVARNKKLLTELCCLLIYCHWVTNVCVFVCIICFVWLCC